MDEYIALHRLRHRGADGRYRMIEPGEAFCDISPEAARALIAAGAARIAPAEGLAAGGQSFGNAEQLVNGGQSGKGKASDGGPTHERTAEDTPTPRPARGKRAKAEPARQAEPGEDAEVDTPDAELLSEEERSALTRAIVEAI